jgi:hypothetical protein
MKVKKLFGQRTVQVKGLLCGPLESLSPLKLLKALKNLTKTQWLQWAQ